MPCDIPVKLLCHECGEPLDCISLEPGVIMVDLCHDCFEHIGQDNYKKGFEAARLEMRAAQEEAQHQLMLRRGVRVIG